MRLKTSFLIQIHKWIFLIWLSSHVIALSEEAATRKQAEKAIERFKMKLHRTLDEASIRRRRSFMNDGDKYEAPAIVSKKNYSSPLHLVAWCVLRLDDEEFAFAATEKEIGIFEGKFLPLVDISNGERIYLLLGFQYEVDLRLVSIQKYGGEYSFGVYKYSDNDDLVLEASFALPGESLAMIAKVQHTIYLPILSNIHSESILNLFVWNETKFHSVAVLPLKGNGKSLASWDNHGVIFVAVSFDDCLKIFHFPERTRRLVLTQQIEQSCNIVKHFELAKKHYLVCSARNKILLHWWNGSHFIEQQEICDLDPAVDIALMNLSDDNVVIVSVKHDRLEFYFQDSGFYIKWKRVEILEYGNLKSANLWKKTDTFYLLPVFQDYSSLSVVSLDVHFPKPSQQEDKNDSSYSSCVLDLEKMLIDTDDKIRNTYLKRNHIWTKNRPSHIPDVYVKGAVVSNRTTKISQISFDGFDSLIAQSVPSLINKLNSKLRKLQKILRNVVLKSTYQEVFGSFKFHNPIKSSSTTISRLADDLNINGINASSLISVLKKTGSQTIPSRLTFNGGNVKNIETNFLNSKGISDYILLLKQWEYVKGHLKFKDLSVNNLKVKSNMVNNIALTDMVTASSSQNVTSRKTFHQLSSVFITTNNNVNGVNMTNLRKITLKDTAEFGKMLNFTSDVAFKNILVSSINGRDISHLVSNSVKCSEDQSIQGIKTFTGPMDIESNLFIIGYVNNMILSNLMTLHTPQICYNNFEIADVSFDEIKTHSVNGIDLCKEAIHKSGDCRVENKVRFTQDLVIDNIVMQNGVSLDNIDVSSELPFLISTEEFVFNEPLQISNINVKNNVAIADVKIRSLLSNLMNNVWFKTKTQYIPFAHFKVMNAIDLNTNSLNDVSFNEIALCGQPAIIYSEKEFVDVEVQSIVLQDGKTVNNVDFTSKSIISTFFEKIKSFVFEDILIKGNLVASRFNDINISNLMQVKKFQESDGSIMFNFISVDELIASTLNFESIYGKIFLKYVAESVPLRPLRHIFNKKFNFISSENLNIAGFLNGEKFEDLINKVVTLNSHQIISSDIKFNSGLMMKSASIKSLSIPTLNDIVCKDRAEKNILHKRFQRIYANEADIGMANGVDISGLQNAFFKMKDNWISKEMKFKSNLRASKIQILSTASIDGVRLDDVFKVNEDTNLASMNLTNFHSKNVNISGKINGCHLSDVGELLRKSLSVKTKKTFTNLVVDGNLYVKKSLNGVPESSFSSIISSLQSMFDLKTSLNFVDVKATQLNVLEGVNGIDLGFLLKDAVMPDIPQNISGKKSFSKITASSISVYMLNVVFLNRINFPLLYRKYLSKETDQIIALNLANISANEVLIEGRLNRVKLPEDVVLVNSKDSITSNVIFQKPISPPNMRVDKVNNIDLLQFLRNVVSLKADENVSSTLTFVKDFTSKGDLNITSKLHEVNLSSVVKTSSKFLQNIVGHKHFSEELNLTSVFNVSGFINGVNLTNLFENLCQKSKFEFIDDKVYFTGLRAPALESLYVNKISPDSLWKKILEIESTINGRLDNATDDIVEINSTLIKIKDSYNGPSFLAYFELHQILNVGYSLRFLPLLEAGVFGDVYQLSTKEMIAWINKDEACTNFKSLRLAVQSDGTLKEIGRINGKIFPFSLRVLEEDVEGFNLHVDRTKRCTSEKRTEDILKTVLTIETENDNIYSLPLSSNSSVLDAKMLETEDGIFIVIAYEVIGDGERMRVLRYDFTEETWNLWQEFHSSDVSSFDMIYVDDESDDQKQGHLVLTGKDADSGIYLYLWDFKTKKFILKSNIPKLVSTSALWTSTDQNVFLLLAKEKTKVFKNNVWTFIYSDPVEVYVLEDDLKLCYEINIYGVSSFDTFKIEGETYVLAVSPHLQIVYLLQYRGYSGFQVIQEFSSPGVVSVSVFSSGSDIFLAIASKTGHTRILKCIMRGGHFVGRELSL